jgi:hypothetical protein
MAIKQIEVAPRDGTSQIRRVLAALDPRYVLIDERSAADFVSFAREFSRAVKYFDLDDRPAGDFSGFIGDDKDGKIAAFLSEPARFDPDTSPELFRPHFVLLLVFVKLLEQAQLELNKLTQRHLEFYYRQFLRLVKKGPVADRVHLLVDLAARGREVLVRRGSLLNAGPDSAGQDRIYATDRDLVVNRAQIAKLSSLFVDRRLVGFKETRAQVAASEVGLALLRLALGEPGPGDPLPLYAGLAVDQGKLEELDKLTQFTTASAGYYLSLSELRDLVSGKAVAIATELTDEQLAARWGKVNALLELAGQRKRKDATYRLPASTSPSAFRANAAAAIGSQDVPGKGLLDVEGYFGALRELEKYFFMTAEGFHQVYLQFKTMSAQGWDRVDMLLAAAREDKVRDQRRQRLKDIHTAHPLDGLAPLIQEVVGNAAATPDDLLPLLGGDASTMEDLQKAAGNAAWDRVYSILEVALSNRIGNPVAQREDWINLHPAQDATRVGVRGQAVAAAAAARWATFGLPVPSDPQAPPAPAIGWAVSSPLLALREGERTITLTLGFGSDSVIREKLEALLTPPPPPAGQEPLPLPLVFELSTEKGWIPCAPVEVTIDSYAKLLGQSGGVEGPIGVRFKLSIAKSTGAITALPPALAPPGDPGPTLRLRLRPVWNAARKQYVAPYRELGSLILLAAQLKVAVTGVSSLKLQSDDAVLDGQKPFEPFGSAPAVGSRLLLGHPEIVQKKLDSLSINIKWMGVPADLDDYYTNYDPKPQGFTARVCFVDSNQVSELHPKAPLFLEYEDIVTKKLKNLAEASWTIAPPKLSAPPPAAAAEPLGDDLSSWTRHLQCELNSPDFQHSAFAATASRLAVELAAAIANNIGAATPTKISPAKYSVKPPYTPKIKSLTIDYSASQEVQIGSTASVAPALQLLHIHPFGQCSIEAERTAAGVPFLPRYEHDGELYIGLSGVAPEQTVALFFQLAEGTSDPELEPQAIKWSYLDADRWVPLGSSVLLDTTRGLLNSGIVELGLKAAGPSTRLQSGLYWLRAAIARNPAVVCDTIAVHTQGVSATLQDRGSAGGHYREPLAPGKLTKFVTAIPLITGVRQPYASFGGRIAESDGMWATRVSERLRHKQRALSMWDYEQLILARFPEVYKVKCVPAGPRDRGRVGIIIIPDIKNLLPSDPFAPKAPARLLADIEGYLADKTPAFVSVKVRNARYVPVRVRLRVRFREDGNQSYYTQLLNDELNRFLSPWAYEEGADIVLGGRIYANSIIDFVDRRPYVDFVAGVTLFRSEDGERFVPAGSDFVEAGQPDAVLVAARTHVIDVLYDAIYDEKRMTGIGFIKVELDFIVA